MANTLASTPPPLPQQQGALTAPGAPPPQQPQIPAPSYQQTVAALRHFSIIGKQLETILKDPDLGKTDMKDKVLDGMTDLVADRIISPGSAIQTLATFPTRFFDQKQWLIQHYQQAQQARIAVLDHHRMTNLPLPQLPPTPSADSHMSDIASMVSGQYGGANG